MNNQDATKSPLADQIVSNHVKWSVGAGLIWIPFADILAVTGIQLDMIRQLCNVYDLDFKDTKGKAIVSALGGTSAARLGASAMKAIPGVGSIAGGLTMSALSGATTFALGHLFKSHFETGGTLLDFDVSRLKQQYEELFEKGKDYVRHIKEEDQDDAPEKKNIYEEDGTARELERLFRLKEQGALTSDEFDLLKQKLLGKI